MSSEFSLHIFHFIRAVLLIIQVFLTKVLIPQTMWIRDQHLSILWTITSFAEVREQVS